MLNYAKIGDKEYPVNLGNAALVAFEIETGISIAEFGQKTSYSNAVRLAYCGLRDGARRAKKEWELSFEEVCDLFDDDPDALPRIMALLEKAMPKADGEKKAKAAKAAR